MSERLMLRDGPQKPGIYDLFRTDEGEMFTVCWNGPERPFSLRLPESIHHGERYVLNDIRLVLRHPTIEARYLGTMRVSDVEPDARRHVFNYKR